MEIPTSKNQSKHQHTPDKESVGSRVGSRVGSHVESRVSTGMKLNLQKLNNDSAETFRETPRDLHHTLHTISSRAKKHLDPTRTLGPEELGNL